MNLSLFYDKMYNFLLNKQISERKKNLILPVQLNSQSQSALLSLIKFVGIVSSRIDQDKSGFKSWPMLLGPYDAADNVSFR